MTSYRDRGIELLPKKENVLELPIIKIDNCSIVEQSRLEYPVLSILETNKELEGFYIKDVALVLHQSIIRNKSISPDNEKLKQLYIKSIDLLH